MGTVRLQNKEFSSMRRYEKYYSDYGYFLGEDKGICFFIKSEYTWIYFYLLYGDICEW